MDLDVQGSTFDSNRAYFGGALYVDGDAILDADTRITNNAATSYSSTESGYGGAFYCNNGSMAFDATQISGNAADSFGGGGLTLNCDLSGGAYSSNIAGLTGGGLYMLSDGAVLLEDATLSGNEASYAGGVMFDGNLGAGSFTADGLTVEDNVASILGGGAWVLGASLDLSTTTLSGNKAAEAGGAIYAGNEQDSGASELTCDAVDVTSNVADSGAGYYLEGSSLELVGGLITDNTGSTAGGGAYLLGSTLTSDTSDWSGTSSDNTPDDIYVENADTAYDSYGTGESFSCDNSGCE
jgi:predicted outer membrane repeat protein